MKPNTSGDAKQIVVGFCFMSAFKKLFRPLRYTNLSEMCKQFLINEKRGKWNKKTQLKYEPSIIVRQ